MTDQTPQPPVNPFPGIRDYLITIPVSRETDDGETLRAELRVRVPAPGPRTAGIVGDQIARVNSMRSTPAGGSAWRMHADRITVQDVDDTPAVDELLAHLAHQKRILAGLAAKFPTILQLTEQEYAAANPDAVQAVPVGQAMMFVVPPPAADQQEPLLLPADQPDELPRPYGGHDDPDVRRVRAGRIVELPYTKIEIQDGAYWLPIEKADTPPAGGVALVCNTQNEPFGPDTKYITLTNPALLVNVRPVTVPAEGADLPIAAYHDRQALTEHGWLSAIYAAHTGDAGTVTVRARDNRTGEIRELSYGDTDPVLLRAEPGEWWPR